MVKFCLHLLCLLLLAGCSHAPQAQQVAPDPSPMAKDPSPSEASYRTALPVPSVKDVAVLDHTVEPDAAVKPDLPERLAEEQVISRAAITAPIAEATVSVGLDVPELTLVDVVTTKPDTIEREVSAPPMEEAASAEVDLPEPEVDKQKGEDMALSELDLFTRDVEDMIEEPDLANSTVDSELVESVVEHAMLEEPAPKKPNLSKPELSETVREEERDTSHLITTQLTVVSTTGTVFKFLSGDELKSSVPLSQVATGVVRYKGAREVELWKSSHGGDTMADSIMEVVGTATLLGDASSYMLLCASAEVPHEQNVLRLLMLPYGLGHVSDNSMCFVNLTGSDLEIQLDERKFIIPSESHYDFKIDDARRNKVHIVAGVKPLQPAPNRAVSEELRNPLGTVVIFLPSENPLIAPQAIRMQIMSSSGMLQRRITPHSQVMPEPMNSKNTPASDEFLQRHPIMTPEVRTY